MWDRIDSILRFELIAELELVAVLQLNLLDILLEQDMYQLDNLYVIDRTLVLIVEQKWVQHLRDILLELELTIVLVVKRW